MLVLYTFDFILKIVVQVHNTTRFRAEKVIPFECSVQNWTRKLFVQLTAVKKKKINIEKKIVPKKISLHVASMCF